MSLVGQIAAHSTKLKPSAAASIKVVVTDGMIEKKKVNQEFTCLEKAVANKTAK